MKIQSTVKEYQSNISNNNITSFNIKQTPKSFAILSSGLYSNKKAAIIRELCCNAYDSHVAANKENEPFLVQLPNTFQPYLMVTDFGTGLSPEEVERIYTTYFESTKTDSNDFTGCLGLGSKSPFAYTDSFTITAIKNGIKSSYIAFIAENGIPSLTNVLLTDTTEENGVEIKIAIDTKDINEFVREASNVLKYFKIKPQVVGKNDFVIDEVKYKRNDLIEGVHSVSESGYSYVVMGNIRYPLQHKPEFIDYHHLMNDGWNPLEFNFPIGSLDISASREELSYDRNTINTLIEKFKQLEESLKEEFISETQYKPKWEQVRKIKYSPRYLSKIIEDYKINNSIDLSFKVNRVMLADTYNVSLTKYIKNGNTSIKRLVSFDEITPSKYNDVFVVNIGKTGIEKKVKELQKTDNTYAAYYIISPVCHTKDFLYKEFLEYIGNPHYITSDTLPNVKTKSRAKSDDFSYYRMGLSGSKISWGTPLKNIDKGLRHIYVEFTGHNTLLQNTDVKKIYEWINSNMSILNPPNLVGVNKKHLPYVKTLANWKPLEEWLSEKISTISDGTLNQMSSQIVAFEHNYLTYLANIKQEHDFFELIKDMSKKTYVRFDKYSFGKLCDLVKSDKSSIVINKVKEYETKINKYPLLKLINGKNYFTEQEVSVIVQYIEMMDGATNVNDSRIC